MDFSEMIFLAFLGLVLFGPRKLPELARTVGRFMAELKRASSEFRGQFTREVGDLELSQPARALSSFTDRVRAINAADGPAPALMALADLTPPQTPQAASVINTAGQPHA
jgi:sec-independent protein translocase protein TatB